MAPKSKTSAKTRDPAMGIFVDYMRSRGPTPVLQVVKEVTQVEEPCTGQLDACLGFMRGDDRFIVTGEGLEAVCVLVGAERAESPESQVAAEPEDITAAVVSAESGVEKPESIITGPTLVTDQPLAGTGEGIQEPGSNAEPVRTIGERLAANEATKVAEPTANTSQPHTQVPEPTTHDTELDMRFQALRALTEELSTFEDEYARLSKARSEAKKAVDVTRAKMIEVIEGKSMEEIEDLPVFKMAAETKPAKSETLQAIAETIPASGETKATQTETPTGLNFWDMGAAASKDPSQEINCPISREKDAQGVSYWLAGFRKALAVDQDAHEAQVQALFRPALLKAALPNHGFLPKGEDQPKVLTVRWNERPHLVLDMVIMEPDEVDENGVHTPYEEWHLLPLVDRDEWGNLYEKDYGPAVKGSHQNPEKESDRLKGGVDTGRLVKSGRQVMVVSPRKMLAVVYCDKGE